MQRIVILGAGFGGLELATILVGGARRRRRRDADRQERRVRLRLLEARRDVRAHDARRPCGFRTATSRSPACGSCRRRSRRSTPRRGGSPPTPASTRPTCSSSRSAPTTTSTRRPGLAEAGNEFYSVAGAERLARDPAHVLARPGGHRRLRRAVQVPAGAERGGAAAARLPVGRAGVRDACEITIVIPFGTPVPPSPDTSVALVERLRRARHRVRPEPPGRIARRGAQRRRARRRQRAAVRPLPRRAEASRARRRDRERHDRERLHPGELADARDAFPGVYAIGDVATVGVPKAGVFAEGAARSSPRR